MSVRSARSRAPDGNLFHCRSLQRLNEVRVRVADTDLAFPDGLAPDHAKRRGGWHRHANLLSLAVLGALMALAMTGLLAGGRTPERAADFATARLGVTVPKILRNGQFFEMRIDVAARSDIADLRVTLPPALWRDMTINTMIPAASEEAFADGAFDFGYGPLAAGKALSIKIDGQINPPLTLGTRGDVAIHDGDERIGAVPITIRVLP